MFKKEFGVSIYPEHGTENEIKSYLDKAKKYGFTRVFMSWIHWTKDEYIDLYIKTIKIIKDLGFYIVLDINDDNFDLYKSLGVDCLRLDLPVLPKEIADLTYSSDLDIQLNITTDDYFVNNILDFKPVTENLQGCHNFYLKNKSGIGLKQFKKSTKRFNDLGIHTSAFINSQTGKYCAKEFPIDCGAVTIENMRFWNIKTQAKYLLGTKQIDCIYIANQFASDDELKAISEIDTKNIELDVFLNKQNSNLDNEILFNGQHFSRGDVNENFIRSTMGRKNYKNRSDLKAFYPEPYSLKKYLNKGDVVIINANDKNYQYELNISCKNKVVPLDDSMNCVAFISKDDNNLIELITAWQHFTFKEIKKET